MVANLPACGQKAAIAAVQPGGVGSAPREQAFRWSCSTAAARVDEAGTPEG